MIFSFDRVRTRLLPTDASKHGDDDDDDDHDGVVGGDGAGAEDRQVFVSEKIRKFANHYRNEREWLVLFKHVFSIANNNNSNLGKRSFLLLDSR